MALDLSVLRPAYNGSAITASALVAPWWANLLDQCATVGDGFGPAGLTLAAVLVGWRLDRTRHTDGDGTRHSWWLPRVALFTPLTALPMSPAAAHAVLTITVGATS
ncbi:hypothetical protein [Kitasatospora sp. NPDC050543]|uniref:hypothetical protein n=1 Tax=Kitasatospora sp. NPDC050543 TaxID=3364054 RepID=UPI0037A76AFD